MSDKIEWCIAKLGQDYKWWVEKMSNDGHIDSDCMGIVDPKQFEYIMELVSPLMEYGLREEILERAFLKFRIASEVSDNEVKLTFVNEKALTSEEPLFLYPNVVSDNEGPYAEFIDQIVHSRVRLLNDAIDFKVPMNTEEIEDAMKVIYQEKYIEGNVVHVFDEIVEILEYTPAGYDIDRKDDFENDDESDVDFDIDDEGFDSDTEDWKDEKLHKLEVADQ